MPAGEAGQCSAGWSSAQVTHEEAEPAVWGRGRDCTAAADQS